MKEVIAIVATMFLFINCNNLAGDRVVWTDKDRSEMTNNCIASATPTMGIVKAQNYCTCMQKKMEVRFPDPKDAAKVNSETMKTSEMQAMVKGCLRIDSSNVAPWTEEQFGSYIKICATAQKREGMTEEDAITYCGCMTRKIAVKYTYEAASKMTPADFQTDEWKTIANDCKTSTKRIKIK